MPIADCFDPNTAQYRVKDPSPDKTRQLLLADGYTAGPDGKLQKDGQSLTIVLVSTTTTGLGNGGEYLDPEAAKVAAEAVRNQGR